MSEKFLVLEGVIDAWKAGDIDGALAHMTDDIVWHYAAAIAPPLKGKIAARKFLEGFKAQILEVRWRIFDYAERGDRLFVEGVDEYVSRDGALIAAPYAGVLEFRDSLIAAWRDYLDVGVVDAQKAGTPASPWLKSLIDRAPAAAPSFNRPLRGSSQT